jgi:cytochrome c-type biogenesis protein
MLLEFSIAGLLTAFVGGIASFLSPCVLPLVPGYLSYIAGGTVPIAHAGQSGATASWRALGLSGCFVAGFSIVFIALGASVTTIGRLFLAYRYELNIIAGIAIAAAGLVVMGAVKTPIWVQRYYRFNPSVNGGRPLPALFLGMAFGFGWTPCIGPVLGGILALGATSSSVSSGMLLLSVYALGLGVPFLLAALFMTTFTKRLGSLRRAGRILQIVTGIIMVVMGIAVASGQLMRFAVWLLKTFPVLGGIG